MPRCAPPASAAPFPGRPARPRARVLAVLAACALAAAVPARAQVARQFPKDALRGRIAFGAPPAILLNGQPARLSPGARLHGADNLLHTTAQFAGASVIVDYTLEPSTGLVREVWVLRPDEAARQPWPQTPAQAAAWSFDPVAQAWTQP